jgi:hypothetical protein
MWLTESLLAFLLSVALNAGATRLWKDVPPFVTFLGISTLIFAGLAGRYFFSVEGEAIDMVAGLLLFAAATEFYVLLILLVANSISVSILLHARSRPLSSGALAELYSEEKMLAMRLHKIVSMGLVEGRDGIFFLTPSGRRLLNRLDTVRKFFGHGTSVPKRTVNGI